MPVLKAKIGGVWTEIGGGSGGTEEVFVGPADPGTAFDLWVDTDAVSAATGGAVSTDPGNEASLGSDGLVYVPPIPSLIGNFWSNTAWESNPIGLTPVPYAGPTVDVIAGHWYEARVSIAVTHRTGTSGSTAAYVEVRVDQAPGNSADMVIPAPNVGVSNEISFLWEAPATRAGVPFDLTVAQSWWATLPVVIIRQPWQPFAMTVTDLGPYRGIVAGLSKEMNEKVAT